jgi:predicted kinase
MDLVIMCGLPRSGKSTYCDELKSHGFEVVELDKIRRELTGLDYLEDVEPVIFDEARSIAMDLLSKGSNVVIDESNVNVLNLAYWLKLSNKNLSYANDLSTTIIYMTTDENTCLSRTTDENLKSVIKRKNIIRSTEDQVKELCEKFNINFKVI